MKTLEGDFKAIWDLEEALSKPDESIDLDLLSRTNPKLADELWRKFGNGPITKDQAKLICGNDYRALSDLDQVVKSAVHGEMIDLAKLSLSNPRLAY